MREACQDPRPFPEDSRSATGRSPSASGDVAAAMSQRRVVIWFCAMAISSWRMAGVDAMSIARATALRLRASTRRARSFAVMFMVLHIPLKRFSRLRSSSMHLRALECTRLSGELAHRPTIHRRSADHHLRFICYQPTPAGRVVWRSFHSLGPALESGIRPDARRPRR